MESQTLNDDTAPAVADRAPWTRDVVDDFGDVVGELSVMLDSDDAGTAE